MVANYHSLLAAHLDQDEELLWTGAPKKGVVFRPADFFLIPFSILWCTFAIVWMVNAWAVGGLFALFGVPFVFFGLLFVFGRFIIDAKRRANTVYGITAQRILISSGLGSKRIRTLNIRSLADLELSEKPSGYGTITLGAKDPLITTLNWLPGAKVTPSLELIPNAQQVYRRILDLQKKSV